MKKQSQLFKDLKKRVKGLNKKFMSSQLKAEALHPFTFTSDLDNIAAYRLLIHAEIEDYLERKARACLDDMRIDVRAKVYKTKYIPHIFAMSCALQKPIEIKTPYSDQNFIDYVLSLISAAEDSVNKNNGIKEHSFVNLSLFAGVKCDSIDATLLSSLTTYGTQRGDVAHRGVGRVRNLLAPSAEVKAVEDLISNLKVFFY